MVYVKTRAAVVVWTTESRINAKFDAQPAQWLPCLTTTTGLGIIEVVWASVPHYYRA